MVVFTRIFESPNFGDFASRFVISDSLVNDPDVEASTNTANVPGGFNRSVLKNGKSPCYLI